MNSSKHPGFASRWGFILASVGSAVGMANVWGFPNKMGSNGGGAFLLIYLLFYSAEDFFSFHFAGEEYVVFVMAGGCALTIVLQGCIIAALNSANEAAVKARATTLPPMLLAVIVMAEAAMQIIGLAMYWGAPYLDYDIALQLYGMFGYLNGNVLLHMFSLLLSAVSGILFSVVTLRYRREVSAAMEADRQMYSDTKWGAKESYHLCVNTTERYMKEIVPGLPKQKLWTVRQAAHSFFSGRVPFSGGDFC